MPLTNRRNQSGFSLIEFLIVVMIILIIAAAAAPGLRRAREAVEQTLFLNTFGYELPLRSEMTNVQRDIARPSIQKALKDAELALQGCGTSALNHLQNRETLAKQRLATAEAARPLAKEEVQKALVELYEATMELEAARNDLQVMKSGGDYCEQERNQLQEMQRIARYYGF